jgi:hypothetical protein
MSAPMRPTATPWRTRGLYSQIMRRNRTSNLGRPVVLMKRPRRLHGSFPDPGHEYDAGSLRCGFRNCLKPSIEHLAGRYGTRWIAKCLLSVLVVKTAKSNQSDGYCQGGKRMKILPLLFGSLAASIALGGAAAQMSAPLEHYSLPPGYGASTNPPEGRSISPDRYPYHHSGTRGRLGRGANPRHTEGPGDPSY